MFVYDSYHLPASEWATLLQPGGSRTVRGTHLDAAFVGLWLDAHHGTDLSEGGFDGAYTYFATDGASYGATTAHWAGMKAACDSHGMLFVPSVAPGYDDSKIRPWNAAARRDREGGEYYRRMWRAALQVSPSLVTVTSYNEFGEGTQIEAAVPRTIDVDALAPHGLALPRHLRTALALSDSYSDYGEAGPQAYMAETAAQAEALHAALGLPPPFWGTRQAGEGGLGDERAVGRSSGTAVVGEEARDEL
jgi:glycoprotein endo-alpha-1,2-mannosidase